MKRLVCKWKSECATDFSHMLSQDSTKYEDLYLCLHYGSHPSHDCKYTGNFEEYVFKISQCLVSCVLVYMCQFRRHQRRGFNPWVRKIPWKRAWQPTPVLLPRKSHGWRSLVGYSPWGSQRVRHDWVTSLKSYKHTENEHLKQTKRMEIFKKVKT